MTIPNNKFYKVAGIFLLPFSAIYSLIMVLRNFLFDSKLIKPEQYEVPVIGVGNITVGGTGKTPVTEYLLQLLIQRERIVVSRGYGRRTKGFRYVTLGDDPDNTGDEPLQMKQKFPRARIAVCANRRLAIRKTLEDFPVAEVIILDDNYQHRWVKPDFQIVLVDYNRPVNKDFVLPAGRLREPVLGFYRANIILITKCPPNLTSENAEEFARTLAPGRKNILFSTFTYSDIYFFNSEGSKEFILPGEIKNKIILITGIANPTPLVEYLEKFKLKFDHLKFKDHHNYSEKELTLINKLVSQSWEEKIICLCTEKDYVKLRMFGNKLLPGVILAAIPVKVEFLFEGKKYFDKTINEHVG